MTNCTCWRQHSKDSPRGQKCPDTIEALQAAWERDQEVMFQMREEIARMKSGINRRDQEIISLKSKINRPEQK